MVRDDEDRVGRNVAPRFNRMEVDDWNSLNHRAPQPTEQVERAVRTDHPIVVDGGLPARLGGCKPRLVSRQIIGVDHLQHLGDAQRA